MPSIHLLRRTVAVGALPIAAPDVNASVPVTNVAIVPQGPSDVGMLTPATTLDLSSVPHVILTSATSYLPFIGVGIASAMGTAIFAYAMRQRHRLRGKAPSGDSNERTHVLHVVLRDERTQSGPGVAELELKR